MELSYKRLRTEALKIQIERYTNLLLRKYLKVNIGNTQKPTKKILREAWKGQEWKTGARRLCELQSSSNNHRTTIIGIITLSIVIIIVVKLLLINHYL